jgi:hypothetical protein
MGASYFPTPRVELAAVGRSYPSSRAGHQKYPSNFFFSIEAVGS